MTHSKEDRQCHSINFMQKLTMADYKVIYGAIVNPLSDQDCDFYPKGVMVLKRSPKRDAYQVKQIGLRTQVVLPPNFELLDFGNKLILPGLYDLHFHWVQDEVCLKPKDDLLHWLKHFAWPAEVKFKDLKYCQKKAKTFFGQLAKQGTIGGGCFSSIHGHALAEAFNRIKGHFIIGNVLMTMNSPQNLQQTQQNALNLVRKFASRYKNKYALTPRFAPSTHPKVMQEGARIVKKYGGFIQSHLSENKEEIKFVLDYFKKLPGFKNVKSYTEIYQRSKTLGAKTIMAHGIHLDTGELKILQKTKTSIAVCPTSNAPLDQQGLGSGLCDHPKLEHFNIPWALGSDIGAGPYLSMFDVMSSWVSQNRKAKRKGVSFKKALYRCTLKSAQILKMQAKRGNLSIGKEADFIVLTESVQGRSVEKNLARLMSKSPNQRQRYQNLVAQVYLSGNKI